MAHAYTVTVSAPTPGWVVVDVRETDAAAASEIEIDLTASGRLPIPALGNVAEVRATLVSGTATTIDPVLGTVTDPGAAGAPEVVAENETAAANVINRYAPGSRYRAGAAGKLYHRSRASAGSDNVIRTVYFIQAGW